MKQHLDLHRSIASHRGYPSIFLRAAVFLAAVGFAFTTQASTDEPPKCVFQDLRAGEECPAFSTSRALEFLAMGEEAVIFLEKDQALATAIKTAAVSTPARVSILASSRIEDSVLLEQIDEDDAMLLEREVQELSGARYELPRTRSEVKKLVGFPETAVVASEDWIEMLRVHAEMSLSLSKNASRFLLEQLGLASTATVATASAATVLPDSTMPASTNSLNPAVVETH